MVPCTASRILDIGCGTGRLGESIKARQPAKVVGVEFIPEAAEKAKERLDHVLQGDVEELDQEFEEKYFDTVICGDVLEHLRDPAKLLRRVRKWIRPDGTLVASIPNVRHHTVVRSLLAGNWTYEPAGLLDRDHLRFFTRREIEKLFYRAGFEVRDIQIIPGPGDTDLRAHLSPDTVQVGRLQIAGLAPEDADEFYAYQFLVQAAPRPVPDFGLTSIIIVTHNGLEFTHQCLQSIEQYTDEPYELILVDNGSTDGTADYLSRLVGPRIIRNETNLGFPAAANQGIQAAHGRQILLLNNDCLVTTGWLSRMLTALHKDSMIGLVGSCSNRTGGPQRVSTTYEDLGELDGFAWDWGKAHDGTHVETNPLTGFCLLIRRELIERIGLLDEQFGIGGLEDDDYCLRADRAGFKAVLAKDAFVHHFGSRTFRTQGIDIDAHHQKNLLLFHEKWKDEIPNYGLTSIVIVTHNQLDYTKQCVESVRRYTDEPYEMIFVDNGSTDGTAEYLESIPNTKVIKNHENRGFPAAANRGIQASSGKQVLLLNNDCIVPFGWIRRLLRPLHSNPKIGMVGPSSTVSVASNRYRLHIET